MKNCSTCEERHPGCEETCEECGYHFPPTEEMVSDDTKENRKNLMFLIFIAIAMMAFVILCAVVLDKVTGGKIRETTQIEQQVDVAYGEI